MKRYTVKLRDGIGRNAVDDEVEFESDDAAFEYANQVARELMRNRNVRARRWRLDIYGADGEWVATLPFAQVDPTLDHLSPPARALIERWSASCLALAETIEAARGTVREARSLVARSRGRPYLVVDREEWVVAEREGEPR
jgi:hypothetical protein